MEEMENPKEQAMEDMHHHAEHSREQWVGWAALSSALLAALAAVTMLMAGHNVNESQAERLQSFDKWNEYQAKKAKSLAISIKDELLVSNGKPVPEKDEKTLARHEEEEKELRKEAEALDRESNNHDAHHTKLAMGATMFQVAIAVAAISVLSKRPPFWYVSLALGALGIFFMARGLMG